MSEEADKQRALKYRDHDLPLEDISDRELGRVREIAIRHFVQTRESDQVRIIVGAFLEYLTSQGHRVIKKENP